LTRISPRESLSSSIAGWFEDYVMDFYVQRMVGCMIKGVDCCMGEGATVTPAIHVFKIEQRKGYLP
jgi:hypothetical protein